MQVILLERVEKLGFMGDVVEVRPGFARNFLLPQKKALRANQDNLKFFETQKEHLNVENLKQKKEAEAVAKKIEGKVITVIRQAGDSGQLYGSVTPKDVADQLSADGFKIARTQAEIYQPIKMLGLHEVIIRLHPEVKTNITVNVAKTVEEAAAQLRGDDPKAKKDEEDEVMEEDVVETVVAEETVEA